MGTVPEVPGVFITDSILNLYITFPVSEYCRHLTEQYFEHSSWSTPAAHIPIFWVVFSKPFAVAKVNTVWVSCANLEYSESLSYAALIYSPEIAAQSTWVGHMISITTRVFRMSDFKISD